MLDKKKSTIRNWVVGTFISVPILSSLISTMHLVSLFNLGNYSWMSILLAVAFELGSIAAFLVPTVLTNIKKGMVYTIFAVLSVMQIIGNVFYSYDFVFNKMKVDKGWLDSFLAFLSNFGTFEPTQVILWLSIIIGVPIPLISLFFLKSWVDYLKLDKEDANVDEPVSSLEDTSEIESDDPILQDVPETISENASAPIISPVLNPIGTFKPDELGIRIKSDVQVPGSNIIAPVPKSEGIPFEELDAILEEIKVEQQSPPIVEEPEMSVPILANNNVK